MPLELGIFIGAKAFGAAEHRRKAAIVLDVLDPAAEVLAARLGEVMEQVRRSRKS